MTQASDNNGFFSGIITGVQVRPNGFPTQGTTFYTADITMHTGSLQRGLFIGRPSCQYWATQDGTGEVEIHPFPLGTLIIGVVTAGVKTWGVLSAELPKASNCA